MKTKIFNPKSRRYVSSSGRIASKILKERPVFTLEEIDNKIDKDLYHIFKNVMIDKPGVSKELGEGSFGKAIRPPIKCKTPKCSKKMCKDGIAKVFLDNDGYEDELKLNKTAKIAEMPQVLVISKHFPCMNEDNEYQIVYEYGGKTIKDILFDDETYRPDDILVGLLNVFFGLYYLQKKGFYHLDINRVNLVFLPQKRGIPLMRIIDTGGFHLEKRDIHSYPLNLEDGNYFFPPESSFLKKGKETKKAKNNDYDKDYHVLKVDANKVNDALDMLREMSLDDAEEFILSRFSYYMMSIVLYDLLEKVSDQLSAKEINKFFNFITLIGATNVFDRPSQKEALLHYISLLKEFYPKKRKIIEIYESMI